MSSSVGRERMGLGVGAALSLVVALALVFGGQTAFGQENPASECGAGVQYWKIQYNDSNDTFGVIEASSGVGSGGISLNASGSWTNNVAGSYTVFRIVLKVGTGVGSDVVHEPPVNPIDLSIQGLSHITFCFNAVTTTTAGETTTTAGETTTTAGETTTTTAGVTTTVGQATTTVEDEVLGTVITSTTVADEVAGTQVLAEELPFTGPETGWLVPAAVLLLISGLMITGLAGSRQD